MKGRQYSQWQYAKKSGGRNYLQDSLKIHYLFYRARVHLGDLILITLNINVTLNNETLHFLPRPTQMIFSSLNSR